MRGIRTFFGMTSWWGFCRSYIKFAGKSYGRHGGWQADLEGQALGFGDGKGPSYAFTARVLNFMETSRSGNVVGLQPNPVPVRQEERREETMVGSHQTPVSFSVPIRTSHYKPESLKSRTLKARNPRVESPYTIYRPTSLPAAVATHGGLRGGAAGKWHRR